MKRKEVDSGKRKMAFIFVILFLFVLNSNAQSWVSLGNEGFSDGEAFRQSIEFIGETPYVSYMDRANGDKATVMKFNGENWEAIGSPGFSPGEVSSLCLAVTETAPYVAFRDEANDNKASVMMFDGANWVFIGEAGFTESSVGTVSLATDNSTLWLAFEDNANNSKVTVVKYEGDEWVVVGSPGFSTGYMTNVINLAVENGTPYVVYRDYGADYKATVMKYNNESSSWELLGQQGFSARTHDAYQCIAVYNGTAYVASWGTDAKATLYKYDGSSWSPLGTDGISTGVAYYQSVKIDPSGTPYMVFSDDGISEKAIVMKYTVENGWEQIGETASKSGADYVSIAFSESGVPHLAFRDNWSIRRTTVMKLASVGYSEILIDSKELLVWPNPGNGLLNVEIPEAVSGKFKLEIFDLLGKVIFVGSVQSGETTQLDLSGIKDGMYWLKATSGEIRLSKAFQIRH